MATEGFEVKVYIYDISRGLAKAMSQALLGKRLEGIWHTGIVVYGQEYYFGGTGGIECCPPCGTMLGQPDVKHTVGYTQIPKEIFIDYLKELAVTSFRPSNYHLLDHNCNTFSSEVAKFLTGNDIPSYITSLPADVMSTPFGQMIRPFVDAMSVQPTGGHALFQEPAPSQSTKAQAKPSQKPQSSSQQSASSGHNKTPNKTPFIFKQENYQSVKQFGSRTGTMFCHSLSGSKLFVKVNSRRQKSPLSRQELWNITLDWALRL